MRKKKALKNIVSTLLLQIITILCGFIIPKLIITKYGSATNGLVTSITQFLGYITLLESGFGPVVKSVLYKPISKHNKKQIENILKATEKFFKTIAFIFIVYIIILCFVYPLLVNNSFDYLYTVSLIIIISMATFAEYFFGITYKLYLQAEQKTYITAIINIIFTILNTVLVIIFIFCGFSIHIVKLISAIVFVIKPLVQNLYVKKVYDINLLNVNSNYVIKQKWDGLAQHIAAVIHNNTDIAVITIFSNVVEVSVYSIYMLIIKGIKSLIQSFSSGIDASFGDMLAKNEMKNLNEKFKIYEFLYHTVASIVFISSIILITPFVEVYTKGITDANYIRPLFGVLITISEFIWAIRLPYSSLTLAAGHFKETKKGAWFEALSNLLISIILVFKFGIIGVAIGTIVSMAIRTIEFMYHTSSSILNRSVIDSYKWLFIIFIDTILAYGLVLLLNVSVSTGSYFVWCLSSIKVLVLVSIEVIIIHLILNYKQTKKLINFIKRR